jgi:hypothetical protein
VVRGCETNRRRSPGSSDDRRLPPRLRRWTAVHAGDPLRRSIPAGASHWAAQFGARSVSSGRRPRQRDEADERVGSRGPGEAARELRGKRRLNEPTGRAVRAARGAEGVCRSGGASRRPGGAAGGADRAVRSGSASGRAGWAPKELSERSNRAGRARGAGSGVGCARWVGPAAERTRLGRGVPGRGGPGRWGGGWAESGGRAKRSSPRGHAKAPDQEAGPGSPTRRSRSGGSRSGGRAERLGQAVGPGGRTRRSDQAAGSGGSRSGGRAERLGQAGRARWPSKEGGR